MVAELALVVLVVVQCDFRWVLSSADRINRLIALRTGTPLPPGGAAGQAPEPPAPGTPRW